MKKVFAICLVLMFFFLLSAENAETIVKIESDPSGAEVFADGKLLCKATPCSKMLTVGSVIEIEMRLPNYLPLSRKEVIKENTPIKFTLQPSFAYLTVSGNYNGDIELDGQSVSFPIVEKVIEPGEHKLSLSDKCFADIKHNFTVKQGEKKQINFNPKPRKSSIKIYAQDESENDLAAEVYVDNALLGKTPGTFEIPLCSKELSVTNNLLEYSEELSLEENQTKAIQAKLKRRWSKKATDTMCFYDAFDYCENLKEDGYDDWKLPNIDELRSLIKNHRGTVTDGPCMISRKNAPLTDRDITSDCSGRTGNNFSKLGDTDEFWAFPVSPYERANVDFSNGQVSVSHSSDGISCDTSNVRCIRSESEELIKELQWSEKIGDTAYDDCIKQNENKKGSDIACALLASPTDPALYCKNLNEGGYTDWRWPNIDELRTLIQNHPGTVTGGKCMISEKNQKIFNEYLTKDCEGIKGSNFSKLGDTGSYPSSTSGLVVNFTNGAIYRRGRSRNRIYSDTFYRCVRDKNAPKPKPVQVPLKQKYLQWSEKAPTALDLEEASSYCNELKEGGFEDWRLPTIADLRTLIRNHTGTAIGGNCMIFPDSLKYYSYSSNFHEQRETIDLYCKESWTTDCAGKNGTNFSKLGDNETFWSSSKCECNYHYCGSWVASFASGEIYSTEARSKRHTDIGPFNYNYVRCVRGENIEYNQHIKQQQEMMQKKEVEKARQEFLAYFNDEAQECYNRRYDDLSRKQRKMEGKISITFDVVNDGEIKNLRVSEDNLDNEYLLKCIVDKFKWKGYPKFGNAVETVTIPFKFKKQGK
ncbi:DUF1566 domain-containing protein [bacterium]|nr:DUF1566 domain-containing protein [bacterium]